MLVTDIRGDVGNCEVKGIMRSFSDEEIAEIRRRFEALVSAFEAEKRAEVCAPERFSVSVAFRH